MSHFAKDRLRQAILQMHAAVRMDEIVRVVVPEERRETEAFHVQVSVREEARATGAERGTDAIAAVLVSVESEQLMAVEIVAIGGAE